MPGLKIIWPQTVHGRARKIITRSGARRRYCVPCFRGGDREAHGESAEEATAAVLLDACAGVAFQEQPARFDFEWRGEVVTHFPDALVVSNDLREFWECKRDDEAKDLLIRRRTDRLRELLVPSGFGYRLVTTSQLHPDGFYENAIAMRRHAKLLDGLPDWSRSLAQAFSRDVSLSAHAALRGLPPDSRHAALWSLLYRGHLVADVRDRISLDSLVRLPSTLRGLPWVWELLEKSS